MFHAGSSDTIELTHCTTMEEVRVYALFHCADVLLLHKVVTRSVEGLFSGILIFKPRAKNTNLPNSYI